MAHHFSKCPFSWEKANDYIKRQNGQQCGNFILYKIFTYTVNKFHFILNDCTYMVSANELNSQINRCPPGDYSHYSCSKDDELKLEKAYFQGRLKPA